MNVSLHDSRESLYADENICQDAQWSHSNSRTSVGVRTNKYLSEDAKVLYNRGPTYTSNFHVDKSLLCVTIAFIVALVVNGLKELRSPEFGSLLHVSNFQGDTCGYSDGLLDRPYLYVPLDPRKGRYRRLLTNRSVCVNTCPSEEDVMNNHYVEVPEMSVITHQANNTVLSVYHTVRSPLYATILYHPLCFPKDPALYAQYSNHVNALTDLSATKQLGRSIYASLPLAVFTGSATVLWVLGISFSTIAYLPHALYLIIIGAVVVPIVLATWRVVDMSELEYSDLLSPSNKSVSVRLFLSSAMALLYLRNIFAWYADSTKLSIGVQTIYLQVGNIKKYQWCYVLCTAVTWITGCYILLCSLVTTMALSRETRDIQISPNGNIRLLDIGTLQATIRITPILLVVLGTIGISEFILTIAKYTGAYVGATYYFTHEISKQELLWELMDSLRSRIGSLAGYATMNFWTRPVRVYFSVSHSTRYQDGKTLRHMNAFLVRVCDSVHNGVLTQMVLSPVPLMRAVSIAKRRVAAEQHRAIAFLIGLGSIRSWAIGIGCGVMTHCIALHVMVSKDFYLLGSQYGGLCSISIAVFTVYIISCVLAMDNAFCDALFYCTLLEEDGLQDVTAHSNDMQSRSLEKACPRSVQLMIEQFFPVPC